MSLSSSGFESQFPEILKASNGVSIAFVHAWPSTFNIGDYLSSPRHYFEFECYSVEECHIKKILIVGGGAFNDLGDNIGSLIESDRKIAWGIGQSISSSVRSSRAAGSISTSFSFFGSRDRALVATNSTLVPCVSVMGDIVDIPPGAGLGVFLNQNPAASGNTFMDALSSMNVDTVLGTNALSEAEFRVRFARTGRIVTNSYHIAYWALLSGRQVALIGYSSKFASLFELFQLPDNITRYERGDDAGLAEAISRALAGRSFSCLPSPGEIKMAFRQLNINYAKTLVREGLFRKIELLEDNKIQKRIREIEVWKKYALKRR
ncbi:hypothetical protein FJW05_20515 [Mesorhizobium sp. B2-9-1]|uniref:hypothetical protein n=1 Tax=Mesorhizobium sp. B2-9-1 TaxID=2589898 RepID=UPI00112A94DC|nr:hypothetical protein [Mesorhizobium sp. B2-9-1]TPI44873.1 hypothetical protein FJW05_20515 [Mesorhizobium sp. B2-9-1]